MPEKTTTKPKVTPQEIPASVETPSPVDEPVVKAAAPTSPQEQSAIITQLMEQLNATQERMKVLEGLAGENAIKSWLEGHKDSTVKRAHLKLINGKPVVSWSKLLKNSVRQVDKGIFVEEQLMHVTFLDGTSTEINYVDFIRSHDVKVYNITAIRTDAVTGTMYFTLTDETGTQIEVGRDFVNP